MADRFPRPYRNEVPKEGSESVMEYVNFDRLGIGARNSGLPNNDMNAIKSLDHVGKSAGEAVGRKWGGK